jgi:hypothetical protein
MEASRPRLVIVDPGYASTVGHHGEVNRPLLSRLSAAGWRVALWADVALEAEAAAPPGLVGAFSGCGYGDLRLGRELGGLVVLARRLEQQLALASAVEGGEPVAAWLGHSLLPFQLLGLARHLAVAPAAQVLVSLMFQPGETLEEATALESSPASEQATGNTRVALAALARACRQQGHRLSLAFPSRQQEEAYGPLFAATGLSSAGVHPAVVGGGCRAPAGVEDPPLVLLHWGDQKPGKGRREALAVLEALLAGPVPEALRGYGWLFQVHGHGPLPDGEEQLLQRAEAAGFGLVVLRGAVASEPMVGWLARCPLALLAYDPVRYRLRSSGVLWHWGASRAAVERPAAAVGYGGGWLATEAAALGLGWHSSAAAVEASGPAGELWLAALGRAAAELAGPRRLSAYGRDLLGGDFSRWCAERLSTMPWRA